MLFFCVLTQWGWAQVFETPLMTLSGNLPVGITSDRVCVIIHQMPEVEDPSLAQKLHLNLKAMGIDAMRYLYYDQLYGGQDVYRKTFASLQKRDIGLLMFVEVSTQGVTLTLARMGTTTWVDFEAKAWQAKGQTINQVLIRLANKMKTLDLPYSNYLISEGPEFSTQVRLFEGTHFPRYPTQLKRFPLAVSLFSSLTIDEAFLNDAFVYPPLDFSSSSMPNSQSCQPPINAILSHASKSCDKEFWISMFDLESYEMTFNEKVGGEADSYIKLKDIEQNETGDLYACIYFNDGIWILRTFG